MKTKLPGVYTPQTIKNWDADKESPSGIWVPARPESLSGLHLVKRLTAAWSVFTGRYDALDWDCPEPTPARQNGLKAYTKSSKVAGDLEGIILNVADQIQYAAEEYKCAMWYLDDLEVPRTITDGGETYSLVGRIQLLNLRNI